MSTFFLTFFSSFFPQVIHNASKSHAKYAIENQSHRGQPHKKVVDKTGPNDSLSHVAGEIIKQGEWGYGDLHGLAKDVDRGYKKWLKKNGLEPEGPNKSPQRLAYGKNAKSKKKG